MPDKKRSKAKKNPKRKPGERYTHRSLDRAIAKGSAAADQAAKEKLRKEGKPVPKGRVVPHWSPGQIRHTVATAMERAKDILEASKYLGHAKPNTTRVYVQADVERVKALSLILPVPAIAVPISPERALAGPS